MKRTREEFFKQYHAERWHFTGTSEERIAQELQMFKDWYDEMEVGDHAHIQMWSDIEPCTVIKRTKTTITVRHDKATMKEEWKPEFIPGGFAGHCVNNDDQENAWNIEEDPNGDVEIFRWHKRRNCYMNTSGEKLFPGWMKKYDYNF